MRSFWPFAIFMATFSGAGAVYLQHVKAELTREVRALAEAVATRDAAAEKTRVAVSTLLTATAIEEAARRGAVAALAARECPPSPHHPAGDAKERPNVVEPPFAPSPEALRAFDEGGAIVAASLRRKVWTEQDRLELEARLPVLDAPLRDEIVGRVLQAANAGLLNLNATHGQVF